MSGRSEGVKIGALAAGGMLVCCSLTALAAAGGLASIAACVGGLLGVVLITVAALGLGAYLWRRRTHAADCRTAIAPSTDMQSSGADVDTVTQPLAERL